MLSVRINQSYFTKYDIFVWNDTCSFEPNLFVETKHDYSWKIDCHHDIFL